MIDKLLVKRRFKKSLTTYTDNATVQKQMAKKLTEMLPRKQYDKVFEIGCATGILTKEITEKIQFKEICVNDIVAESKKYTDNILSDYTFLSGDIETLEIKQKYDLIISNACLQWCNDIYGTLNKLFHSLNTNGILAVTLFGDSNLKQIRNIFEIKEKSYSLTELKQFLKDYKTCNISEDTIDLYFTDLREILHHLKYTGANSIKEYTLTKSALQNYERIYAKDYSLNGKVVLTYNPVYIVITKLLF